MTNTRLLRRETGREWSLMVGTIAIVGSWLYFNRAALQWLTTSIVDVPLFNGAMLVAGGLLLAFLGWRYRQSIELAPGLHRLPLLLIFGCSIATISTQWLVSLPQIGRAHV